MDVTDLKDKMVIQTTRPITNPKPDGRTKGDWRYAKSFPEGMRFVIRIRNHSIALPCADDVILKEITLEEPNSGRTLTLSSRNGQEKRVVPIVQASEVVKPTATEILMGEDMDFPRPLLDLMLESGMLSEEELRVAILALDKKFEEDGQYD